MAISGIILIIIICTHIAFKILKREDKILIVITQNVIKFKNMLNLIN